MKKSSNLIVYALMLAILIVAAQAHNSPKPHHHCKEPNQASCYAGKNEGNFCNSKDQSKTETRWYYDRGVCKSFVYKGCNGNRNRFCTKESCEHRCGGE